MYEYILCPNYNTYKTVFYKIVVSNYLLVYNFLFLCQLFSYNELNRDMLCGTNYTFTFLFIFIQLQQCNGQSNDYWSDDFENYLDCESKDEMKILSNKKPIQCEDVPIRN